MWSTAQATVTWYLGAIRNRPISGHQTKRWESSFHSCKRRFVDPKELPPWGIGDYELPDTECSCNNSSRRPRFCTLIFCKRSHVGFNHAPQTPRTGGSERLMTIPAIGHVTALTWVLEVGEVERFHSVKQAISYCGLCSGEKTSADTSRRMPISKQRNRHLQTVLLEAAHLLRDSTRSWPFSTSAKPRGATTTRLPSPWPASFSATLTKFVAKSHTTIRPMRQRSVLLYGVALGKES
jgi:hypothetical protein